MSEPTYRITTEHKPDARYEAVPWEANVIRLSDGKAILTEWGATEAGVLKKAQAAIRVLAFPVLTGSVYFANEDGSIPEDQGAPAPEPQSLRA